MNSGARTDPGATRTADFPRGRGAASCRGRRRSRRPSWPTDFQTGAARPESLGRGKPPEPELTADWSTGPGRPVPR
jgi:hypothetical protein